MIRTIYNECLKLAACDSLPELTEEASFATTEVAMYLLLAKVVKESRYPYRAVAARVLDRYVAGFNPHLKHDEGALKAKFTRIHAWLKERENPGASDGALTSFHFSKFIVSPPENVTQINNELFAYLNTISLGMLSGFFAATAYAMLPSKIEAIRQEHASFDVLDRYVAIFESCIPCGSKIRAEIMIPVNIESLSEDEKMKVSLSLCSRVAVIAGWYQSLTKQLGTTHLVSFKRTSSNTQVLSEENAVKPVFIGPKEIKNPKTLYTHLLSSPQLEWLNEASEKTKPSNDLTQLKRCLLANDLEKAKTHLCDFFQDEDWFLIAYDEYCRSKISMNQLVSLQFWGAVVEEFGAQGFKFERPGTILMPGMETHNAYLNRVKDNFILKIDHHDWTKDIIGTSKITNLNEVRDNGKHYGAEFIANRVEPFLTVIDADENSMYFLSPSMSVMYQMIAAAANKLENELAFYPGFVMSQDPLLPFDIFPRMQQCGYRPCGAVLPLHIMEKLAKIDNKPQVLTKSLHYAHGTYLGKYAMMVHDMFHVYSLNANATLSEMPIYTMVAEAIAAVVVSSEDFLLSYREKEQLNNICFKMIDFPYGRKKYFDHTEHIYMEAQIMLYCHLQKSMERKKVWDKMARYSSFDWVPTVDKMKSSCVIKYYESEKIKYDALYNESPLSKTTNSFFDGESVDEPAHQQDNKKSSSCSIV